MDANNDAPPDGYISDTPPDGYEESAKPVQPQSNPALDALKTSAGTAVRNLPGLGVLMDAIKAKKAAGIPGAGEVLDKAGGATAEWLGKQGVNPYVAAATGWGVANVPPMIVGGMTSAKPASRAAEILLSGKRIGEAERAAGIITKAADKYPTSGTVGEVLNTLESQLKNGTLTDGQGLKEAKDVIDFIWSNPKIVGKTKGITVQAARVSNMIQNALNAAIPGRAAPAADFATLMRVVNPVKTTVKWGGAATGVLGSLAAIRNYLRSRQP